MRKILVLISICYERGHHFHGSKNCLRPFGNPGILRAYFRYSHAFNGDKDTILAEALALISYFRLDPKNGVAFPLTVLLPHPKTGLL
jgi:hypothetical protein